MHPKTLPAIEFWESKIASHYAKHFPNLTPPRLTAKRGSKYVKIIAEDNVQKQVFCFLDMDGNIYKAATYQSPAKGIRGHLDDENYSFNRGVTVYGGAYAR